MSSHETPGTAGSDPQREPAPGSVPGGVPERREVTVRRAPKYVPFLILGGLVGVAVAAIIAYALPGDASYDRGSVFGFFMVLCAAGGVILGAAVALVLDRLSVRRAEHAVVESAPDADDDENGA
ncbi:hypothetical protein AB4089_12605 [Arthrobacter sp. 2MCAF15]|uniref:hypothetical protein n=1 Tax=Arthrobacter sp. 2MCAF15 TaxID=3232984 RepID=UPI003F914235